MQSPEGGITLLVLMTGVILVATALIKLDLLPLCYYFATLAEHPIVDFFRKFDPPPLPMLTVVGIGFIIAAIAGFLDFSVAIGVFFAGLVFSRDQKAVKMEASFIPLYEFITPFFFITIGLDIEITSLDRSILQALVLLAAAVIGKMLANGVPLWILKDLPTALLVGASMVPRAEIAMVVMPPLSSARTCCRRNSSAAWHWSVLTKSIAIKSIGS